MQDGRIHIEKINEPFLYQLRGTPAEYKAGLERAIANGWLAALDESGTFVKFTEAGCETGLEMLKPNGPPKRMQLSGGPCRPLPMPLPVQQAWSPLRASYSGNMTEQSIEPPV